MARTTNLPCLSTYTSSISFSSSVISCNLVNSSRLCSFLPLIQPWGVRCLVSVAFLSAASRRLPVVMTNVSKGPWTSATDFERCPIDFAPVSPAQQRNVLLNLESASLKGSWLCSSLQSKAVWSVIATLVESCRRIRNWRLSDRQLQSSGDIGLHVISRN